MAFGQNYTGKLIFKALEKAGDAILDISSDDYSITHKDDSSPVTDADLLSDSLIKKALYNISPDIPVISEEQAEFQGELYQPTTFWLLDPLDGTKEFIKGNGEYCISLALIKEGRPVEAYIYWPGKNILWYAIKGKGAYRISGKESLRLPLLEKEKDAALILLRSRSHHKEEEDLWYEKASLKRDIEIIQQGSAIKFCLIAEGKADLYIKKGKIFGWDIAAGDLILSESGGRLIAYGEHPDITYSFNNTVMPHFLACSNRIENPANWLF